MNGWNKSEICPFSLLGGRSDTKKSGMKWERKAARPKAGKRFILK